MTRSIRVIGIDPGLRQTGWGILESQGSSLRFIAAGTLFSDKEADISIRLSVLYKGLCEVLEKYRPDEASVEHVFVNKNPVSSLKLGQARGIALLAPALYTIPVFEYAPNKVKKSVIGVGHGDKQQIHKMVKFLVPKSSFDSSDAADALALAICHIHHRAFSQEQLRLIQD